MKIKLPLEDTMKGKDKLQNLNIIVLGIAVILAVLFNEKLNKIKEIHEFLSLAITVTGACISYSVVITIIYLLINHNKFFLKLYWGKLFLDGFWYYEYTIQNDATRRKHLGIMTIKQDIYATCFVGRGYTSDMSNIRTELRSVTELTLRDGLYEIIYIKTELNNPNIEFYAKSLISPFINSAKKILKFYPIMFNAQTYISGGTHSGEIHISHFIKREEAESEIDVVNFLRNRTGGYDD